MIDEIILHEAPKDQELADGLKWLNSQAFKQGIDTYQIIYHYLYKQDLEKKAQAWMQSRNNSQSNTNVHS